jgi:hypothetical protein
MKIAANPPRHLGKPKEPARVFWSSGQTQFDRSGFRDVLRVRDALCFDDSLSSSLIPFLAEPICITDDLDVKAGFD